MTEDDQRKIAELTMAWGMVGMVRELQRICFHWATYYDPSPSTTSFALAGSKLRDVADFLDEMSRGFSVVLKDEEKINGEVEE